MGCKKPNAIQARILRKAREGHVDPRWGRAVFSCVRAGWLDRWHKLTKAGAEVIN